MSTNEAFVLVTKSFLTWKFLNLSNRAIIAYDVLLNFYNPVNGKAWPNYNLLRHYTGCSRTTLSGAIKELEKHKLIRVDKEWHSNRPNNVYTILNVEGGKIVPPKGLTELQIREIVRESYENKDIA